MTPNLGIAVVTGETGATFSDPAFPTANHGMPLALAVAATVRQAGASYAAGSRNAVQCAADAARAPLVKLGPSGPSRSLRATQASLPCLGGCNPRTLARSERERTFGAR